jgi:hypothetical protein
MIPYLLTVVLMFHGNTVSTQAASFPTAQQCYAAKAEFSPPAGYTAKATCENECDLHATQDCTSLQ